MKALGKTSASLHEIGEEADGQRLDNYLLRHLKGVPKSHIYRIVRSGEVRVNSGRVATDYRLKSGDRVRLPPLRLAAPPRSAPAVNDGRLAQAVLFEDEDILAINKPSGMAVHGGSGVSLGVIERLRQMRSQARFLELVHRLDRDTSGVLLLAKKRRALLALHEQLRHGQMSKFYLALVKGRWRTGRRTVDLNLRKYVTGSGERRVSVHAEGQEARTIFQLERSWAQFSLLRAELKTGRTHQIRVHLAHLGFPIAGDDKYGDFELNRRLAHEGLKRMFLHAARVSFRHPAGDSKLTLEAPLPAVLQDFVDKLEP